MESVIGCDVGKAWIDVMHLNDEARHSRLRNETRAIERFVRSLPPGSAIGMEATGVHHENLADALALAGHTVFVINARWIHNYARSLAVRGKSDRTDAMVIARYVAAENRHLKRYTPPTPEQRELRRLLQQRHAVARLISQTRQGLAAPAVLEAMLVYEREIERALRALIKANPGWQEPFRRLLQVPGIGLLTAAQMVAVLNRLPFANADAFIAHTGMDPRPNDSGQKRGRRRLSHHGDGTLRTLLYMAAMGACRDPRWRELYDAQRRKGLASTAAFIVVARKLARIAFSLVRTGTEYDPSRLRVPVAA